MGLTSWAQESNSKIQLDYVKANLEIFTPDIISTFLYERDMAIQPSGKEIIYTLVNQKRTNRGLVSLSKKNNL